MTFEHARAHDSPRVPAAPARALRAPRGFVVAPGAERPGAAGHRLGRISFEPDGGRRQGDLRGRISAGRNDPVPGPLLPPVEHATGTPPTASATPVVQRFSLSDLKPRNIKDRFNLWRLSSRLQTAERGLQANAPDTAGELAAHHQRLHEIEQTAHAWLRDRNQHASDASRERISGILNRVRDQRRALVGAQLAGGHQLWLPDSVGAGEAQRARGLWNSIRQSQGLLSIEGNQQFRTHTLADVSKLLQSQHGRDMLDDLNANVAGHTTRVRANWDGQFDEDKRGPWARAQDTQAAASPAHGVAGAGSPSFVQIEAEPGGESYLAGEHDEKLPTPGYITLGHELGHARRQVLGQAREDVVWDRPGDPQPGPENLWSNPEEHGNITGQENPLRDELGLPRRRYHRSQKAVFLSRHMAQVRQRYEAAQQHLDRGAGESVDEDERAASWAYGYPHADVDWNGPDPEATVSRAKSSVSRFERQIRMHRVRKWWQRVRPRWGNAYQPVNQ